jgi:hypothetical protein
MPGRNGMGPMGQGPMTGRGMGRCGGVNARADTPPGRPEFGMDRAGGRGGGWRHRNWYRATGLTGWQRAQMGRTGPGAVFPPALSKEQEMAALKQQAESPEQAPGELKSRTQYLDEPTPDVSGKEPR